MRQQNLLTALEHVKVRVFAKVGFASAFGVRRVAKQWRTAQSKTCDVTKAPLLLTEWGAKAAIVQQKMGLRALNACNGSSNSTVGTCGLLI